VAPDFSLPEGPELSFARWLGVSPAGRRIRCASPRKQRICRHAWRRTALPWSRHWKIQVDLPQQLLQSGFSLDI